MFKKASVCCLIFIFILLGGAVLERKLVPLSAPGASAENPTNPYRLYRLEGVRHPFHPREYIRIHNATLEFPPFHFEE